MTEVCLLVVCLVENLGWILESEKLMLHCKKIMWPFDTVDASEIRRGFTTWDGAKTPKITWQFCLWPFWDGEFTWPFQRRFLWPPTGYEKVTTWITWNGKNYHVNWFFTGFLNHLPSHHSTIGVGPQVTPYFQLEWALRVQSWCWVTQ